MKNTLSRLCFAAALLCLWTTPALQAQHLEYARELLDSLCSPQFHGRGYVNNGDKIAASFIAREMQATGLQPFGNSYFAPFDALINTQPAELSLKINGKELRPGIDYLVHADAPSAKWSADVVTPDDKLLADSLGFYAWLLKQKGKCIALDERLLDLNKKEIKARYQTYRSWLAEDKNLPIVGGIIISDKTLLWFPAMFTVHRSLYTVQAKVLTQKLKKAEARVVSKYYSKYPSQNVVGQLVGEQPDSCIVVCAHYDHLGRMGAATYFPGASDNASGVAGMLCLAKALKEQGIRPKKTIVFIAFGGEEAGLQGSLSLVQNAPFPLNTVALTLNLDILGTGDEGIMVVNATEYPEWYDVLKATNVTHALLKEVKPRGHACNSDHCAFESVGVPALYIYTLGGTSAYHHVNDRPANLSLSRFDEVVELLLRFVEKL